MAQMIIDAVVKFLVTGALGFCIGFIKNKKKQIEQSKKTILEEFNELKETQLLDMRNDLSNKFFIYDALPEVEDYLVFSFREKCEKYFYLGGDNWIHPMYDKSFQWKIKPTAYMK